MTVHPFDPPIDPDLNCRNCGDKLLVTAQVFDGGMVLSGIRDYEYTHAHGSVACRPTAVAQPFDAWVATSRVRAIQAERDAAPDALIDAEEATA